MSATTATKRKKGPSAASRLKVLEGAHALAQAELAELQKQHASLKSTAKYHSDTATERGAEIEQVHALLDALPDAVGRKVTAANGYSEQEVKLMTRLAAWLANRKQSHRS